ncbi:MAG: alpha/beta hydrolase [Povalibacter sp.]
MTQRSMLHPLSCIAVCGLLGASTAMAETPSLKLGDCDPQALSGGSASERCGWLTVPENYDESNGRTIRLRITVLPSLRAQPETDALMILAGGPGQGAHDFYASVAAAFGGMRRERDIVLLDQRGTGQSNRMDCAFDDSTEIETADPKVLQSRAQECLKSLPGDPRFYTTSIAVRDLEAARIALGYKQWDLYAVSYGTRVAQHYLHRYPQNVRAMILDGVVPVDLALGPDIAPRAQQALDALFQRCAGDQRCEKTFPRLKDQFTTLRERLGAEPLHTRVADPLSSQMQDATFGVPQLNAAVRLLSYSDETASLLPLLIHEAQTASRPEPLISQYLMIRRLTDEQFAYGMHFAVVCSEDAPRWSEEKISTETLAATYLGSVFMESMQSVCAIWPRGVVDDNFSSPQRATTPTLVLSGGNDPVTPAVYGERVIKFYPHGRHLVIAGQGHGQLTTGCMPRILSEFVAKASVAVLDTQCLDRVAAAPFMLSPSGPAP